MKNYKLLLMLLSLLIIFTTLPAYAKLGVHYEQSTVVIQDVQTEGKITTTTGDLFFSKNAETLETAKSLTGKSARMLYYTIGENKNVVEIRSIDDPPFNLK